MSTAPSSWYIRGEDNQPTGPFTAEQLVGSLRAGRLDATTICWREGMVEWLPIREVEPFSATARTATQGTSACGTSRPAGPPPKLGTMPPTPHAPHAVVGRYFPAIAGCTVVGAVFIVILVGTALMRGKEASDAPAKGGGAPVRTEEALLGKEAGNTRTQGGGAALSEEETPLAVIRDELVAPTAQHDQPQLRTWTDRTGRYQTEASFVELRDGTVLLKNASGVTVPVPLKSLSDADQHYVWRSCPGPHAGEVGQESSEGQHPSPATEGRERAFRGRDDSDSQEAKPDSDAVASSSPLAANDEDHSATAASLPISDDRNGPEQMAGVRTVPRFIEPPLECSCPSWSPDGKYIMFVGRPTEQAGGLVSSRRGASGVVPGNIWVISADGSKRWLVSNFFFGNLQVPEGRHADPLKLDVNGVSWSLDGARIAFSALEGEDRPIGLPAYLYVMRADASDIFRVADKDCARNTLIQWISDGKGLLFNPSFGEPTLADLERMDLHPLAPAGSSTLNSACASRDGTKIAAIIQEYPQGGLGVMRKGSQQVQWVFRGSQSGGPCIIYHPRSWSPDGKQIAAGAANNVGQDWHIVVFDIGSGNARRIVDGATPTWSSDGRQIAFQGGLGDQDSLYLIDPNGQNLRRITNLTPRGVHMIWGAQPRCSPDGRQIVFRRGQHVWVANLDGSGQACVIQGTDYSRGYEHAPSWPCKWAPFWNPDGTVVFARYSKRDYPVEIEVCATGVDSTGVRAIFVWKSPTVALKSPDAPDDVCWSPDGSKLAFDNNQNIWAAKGDGTEHRRLVGGRSPQWSPDGERILFVRGSEHNEVLCIVNADGSNQVQITEAGDGYRAHHRWSPDGKTIAFEGKNGLLVVSAGGGTAHRLIWGQQPCWSPDGKRMAFCAMGRLTSDTGTHGAPCVYVMNADGTHIRPVMQVGATSYGHNRVSYLAWSADSKHIVFEETATRGYDYEDQHHIWIVDTSEPIFYQSSYVASDLLPWEVPQFEPVPQRHIAEGAGKEAPAPGVMELEAAKAPPVEPGPLTGTWQVAGGARFEVADHGKELAITLIESSVLSEFSGKLTRRGEEGEGSKSFTGSVEAVFGVDAPKRYTIRITAMLADQDQLRLRCLDWPVWNDRGKKLGTRILNENWTRQQ